MKWHGCSLLSLPSLLSSLLGTCRRVCSAWLLMAAVPVAASEPQVRVMVSVDWEGDPISEQQKNLAAFAAFRKEFPSIPLVQFLNAAHFTRPGVNLGAARSAIESVLDRRIDELGLHIHGWKSLVQAAGVRYRSTPTITTVVPKDVCKGMADCGYWVQIKHYPPADLAAMITTSRRILRQHGFDGLVSFRAGAWLMHPRSYQVLSKQGIMYDHSEVDWRFVQSGVAQGGAALASFAPWARQLQLAWPQAQPLHQPYLLPLPKGFANPVFEIPNNGALADYTTEEEFIRLFDDALAKAKRNAAPVLLSVGFHMETAQAFIDRMRSLCRHIEQYKKRRGENDPVVTFVTSKGAF